MEIERKYLVNIPPIDFLSCPGYKISQCYISTDPTIRLRRSNNEFILTVKGKGALARDEFELSITSEQYDRLLLKADTKTVYKTRYRIPIDDGLTAELDIYHDRHEGLMTVEVEFESIEKAEAFTAPAWFGTEVTYDRRYSNSYLADTIVPPPIT